MKTFFVYFLASCRNGTLYIGVTSNLMKRVCEHRTERIEGFTKRYHIHELVYFEQGFAAISAFEREKQLKKWKRSWKIELIEKENPNWKDLYPGLIEAGSLPSQG